MTPRGGLYGDLHGDGQEADHQPVTADDMRDFAEWDREELPRKLTRRQVEELTS